MSVVERGMEQAGGKRAKWDRLHQREMGEVKEECERLVGRSLTVGDLGPLWSVLNRWARHRYWTARKHPKGEARKPSQRSRVEMQGEPAPEEVRYVNVPVSTVKQAVEEEKLPWE